MTDSGVFLQLFVGFLLTVTGTSCPITISPPKVVVKYGDPVSFNCTAETQINGMGWEAPQGGKGLTETDHLTWSLKSFTDPSMKVFCFIESTSDETCSREASIVLYKIPEEVQIISNSSDGAMKEGDDYYLICKVRDVAPVENLMVMWYKDDIRFLEDKFNSSIHTLPHASKIDFTPTKENNGVQFRCEAHLDLRPEGPYINISSQTFQINVKFGPEMDCSNIEMEEGETLGSRCPVAGNPIPFVRWLKNEQEINPNEPLGRGDTGRYTVFAEGMSMIKQDVFVHVLYGPEISCQDNYTVLEDTSFDPNCTYKGYPEPQITLLRGEGDGEEVSDLENITRREAGDYTIVATAGNRSVSQTFEIIVEYPPSNIFELEDSDFTLGSSVSLKCSANGIPKPQYNWTYFSAPNVSEENDDGVSRLVIHNATAYNIGSYKCHAWNKHGHVSKSARLTVKGVKQECPLQITPESMVLEYNSERRSATCEAKTTSTNVLEMFWQDNRRIKNSSLEWVVDTHNWDQIPVCNGTFQGIGSCSKTLDVILYKQPDSVSLHVEGGHTALKEDNLYTLVCEVTSVAPVEKVMVRWFKGNESFTPPDKVHASCNRCNIIETKSNVNMRFSTNVTVNRTHNGVEFSCEAALNLSTIPEILPIMSRPLNITVHYPPTINKTKLSSTVPVFSGFAEDLKCEADGNPRPEIRWISDIDLPQRSDGMLSVTQEGKYTCRATNYFGSDYHSVEVIEKTDYLPLIAGFVAVTVVVISVIFVFIYSIYYKNTKMRRYDLKKPKLGAHNGNVAHNGCDMQFPMTKLS